MLVPNADLSISVLTRSVASICDQEAVHLQHQSAADGKLRPEAVLNGLLIAVNLRRGALGPESAQASQRCVLDGGKRVLDLAVPALSQLSC